MSISKHRISYFYDEEIGNFYYDHHHPMKPVRVRMAHCLVLAYGLHNHLQVFSPRRATASEMLNFHSQDYIRFLQNATPENIIGQIEEQKRFQGCIIGTIIRR